MKIEWLWSERKKLGEKRYERWKEKIRGGGEGRKKINILSPTVTGARRMNEDKKRLTKGKRKD